MLVLCDAARVACARDGARRSMLLPRMSDARHWRRDSKLQLPIGSAAAVIERYAVGDGGLRIPWG